MAFTININNVTPGLSGLPRLQTMNKKIKVYLEVLLLHQLFVSFEKPR